MTEKSALRRRAVILFALIALQAAWLSVFSNEPSPKAPPPEKISKPHLPNAFRIHEKLISGGLPEGDAAFAELRELGVQTIISVDGAKPDVERAKKFGMRYVHLPHGYDGISDPRAKELAKAVRDLDGPIYLHCHHGKHRSPAAAAVACVALGWLDQNAALAVLKATGTSENYRGLFNSVRSAQRLDTKLLDSLPADFPESAKLPPLAEAMVAIEHTHDQLKLIAAADWRSPKSHPDLDPAHEALLLLEHFKELGRSEAVKTQPAVFRLLVQESETLCQELETRLRDWTAAKQPAPLPKAIPATFAKITAGCANCHRQFRDVPISEKDKTKLVPQSP